MATRSRIHVFDTTLRDGEQAPGFSMTPAEKLHLALQLDRLGVDIIEAGFPISSDGDFEAVRAIAGAVRRPIIAGLARAIPADIDRAWAALAGAARPRIHVFLATSDIHLEHKLRITRQQCLEQVRTAVAHARALLRGRRVLGGRRHPHRPRVPVRGRGHRGPRRRDDDQPARHRGLCAPGRHPADVYRGRPPHRHARRAVGALP